MRIPDFSKYEVVSFDVFDTLISRLLTQPTDVFKIVERRGKLSGLPVDGFAALRIDAEREARSRVRPEVTLDDIYASLSHLAPRFDTALANSLKGMELQAEHDVCVARPAGSKLFEEARASGARIVITTDMYLPEEFIRTLLDDCGYSGYEALFVSSSCHATKADGSLYTILLDRLNVASKQVLHVGDNPKSDIAQARAAGFATFYTSRARERVSSVEGSFLVASAGIRKESGTSLRNFGYSCLGPVLVGFCLWLNESLKDDGISKVYYLSRDGLIIKRAMSALGLDCLGGVYLYGSRRAFQVPSYALLDSLDQVLGAMFLPRNVSLSKVFSKMGLGQDHVDETLRAAGIDPVVKRPSASLAQDEDARRAFELLRGEITWNAKSELSLLERYLRQNAFAGKLAIVDIGWFGNMQVALERVSEDMASGTEIHGYYVGLAPNGPHQLTRHMRGYLFDHAHGARLFERERNFNMLFEILFSATHGTTRGYREEDGEVVPSLAPYEGVEADVGRRAEEARLGALDFAADFKRVLGIGGLSIAPEVALGNLDRVGNAPSLDEARYFGDWAMESDGDIVYAARPKRLSEYVAHPGLLARDFEHAPWKVGFLKRLFKVPLPYGDLWTVLHSAYSAKKTAGDGE